MHHIIKINSSAYEAVRDKKKTFEIRNNDRGYNAGDTIEMRKYDDGWYCKQSNPLKAFIGYVTGFGQKENYVVFSLLDIHEGKR